ncbi:response regulator FixJ [Terrihabitans sp. B22-R8]|uniref:response regulator FixJ n=1 Tax=Terrihabitans sp. B22-R8 TaxID=3425128 RepID=UPI00403CD825
MPDDAIVHVIDDDDAVRESLSFLLDASGFTANVYESAPLFLDALDEHTRGVILTDVRMPDMTGLDLLRELRGRGIDLPVIIMTGHGDVPLAVEAMKSGAADFLEKPFDDERLVASLTSALATDAEHEERAREQAEIRRRYESLSARECEVLEGLVVGHPNKIIAFELGISPRTVEVYRANVMQKMQAGSLSELVRMVLLNGLVQPKQT